MLSVTSLSVIILVVGALFFRNKSLTETASGVMKDMHKRDKFEEIERKIKIIKLGMTKDEVKSIMGEPMGTDVYEYKGIKKEVWIFDHSKSASVSPQCIFDAGTGKVIEVICGDYYRIVE